MAVSFQMINGGNCTSTTVNALETAFTSLLLMYIICTNALVIFITIMSAELRGCLFSMQLAASYLGNMFGALSLFGNDLFYSRDGVPLLCQIGKDYFLVLYFGISVNMTILVFNTRYRYNGLTSLKRKQSVTRHRHNSAAKPAIRTRDIVCYTWLPALVISLVMCIAATMMQIYVIHYQLLISMGISVIPLGFTIIWNLLLTSHFKLGLDNSKVVQRAQSIRVLKRATFIIYATVLAQFLFLIICTSGVVISMFFDNKYVVKGVSWLLRLTYALLFIIEGHVYIYKVDTAKKIIREKIGKCFYHFAISGKEHPGQSNKEMNGFSGLN